MKFPFLLSLIVSSLLAEDKVLDVFVGSKQIGTYRLSNEGLFDENLTVGICKSNRLSDLADRVEESDDKFHIFPLEKCLKKEILSISKPQAFHFVNSNSAALNYAFSNNDGVNSLNMGASVFALDSLFYAQGYSTTNKTAINNYFMLHESKQQRFKAGTVYTSSGSYLTGGYALVGAQFTPNRIVSRNQKQFDYQLIIQDRSVVEILNNGQLVQKLTFNPGIYNLRDLPISYFSNDIKIIVTDSFGVQKTIDVPFLFNQSILGAGKEDYEFAAGEDTNGHFQGAGFYRRGLTDNLTIGASTDSNNQATMIDYLTAVGKVGIQTDKNFNVALDYLFSKDAFSLGALWLNKNGKNDFRIETGMSFGKYGNLSLRFHQNGETLYGLGYSAQIYKNLSLSLNGNFNETAKTYNTGFRLIWNYSANSKPTIFTAGSVQTESSKNDLLSASIPIRQDHDYGIDGSYEKINGVVDDDVYRVSLKARYGNEIFVNTSKVLGDTHKNFGLSGSIGCVFSEGVSCGIGELIYPENSYLIENSKIRRVPSYWTTEAKNEVLSLPVTLKSGQGYWLDPNFYKTFTGKITLEGKPYAEKTFTVDGKEYFTGSDGEFWVDAWVGKVENFKVEIENFSCEQNFEYTQELNEAQVKCWSK